MDVIRIFLLITLFCFAKAETADAKDTLSVYELKYFDSLQNRLNDATGADRALTLSLLAYSYRQSDSVLAYQAFFESAELSEKFELYQNCYNTFPRLLNEYDNQILAKALPDLIIACEQKKLYRCAVLGSIFHAVLYIRRYDYARAEAILQTALQQAKALDFQYGTALATYRLGHSCFMQSEYINALKFLLEAEQINAIEGYAEEQAWNHYWLGLIEMQLGNFDNATGHIIKSLNYWESVRNIPNMWNCNEVLGNICIKLNDFVKALYYHRVALKIREQVIEEMMAKGVTPDEENYLGIAYSYNNIAETYLHLNVLDSALIYAVRSYELKASENSVATAMDLANSLLILGNVYQKLGKPDSAILMLHQAVTAYEKTGKKAYQANALIGLGNAYKMAKLSEKAVAAYEHGLHLAEEAKDKSSILEGYELLTSYYEEEKHFEKALRYFHSYENYKDSIFNLERANRIEELQIRYETEKRQQELDFQKLLVQKRNRQLQLAVMASVLILLLSASVAYLVYKTRRQKEALLLQQAGSLKKDLELKNKELVCNVNSIYTKNMVINKVARTLAKNLHHFNPANVSLINDIISELRQNMSDCNWKEFETRFAKVHESFYHSLDQKFPDLSHNERKICAMLKLGLSSKEIAAITSTLPESVDTARSRIRKKLNLGKDENLIEFFHNFS